jgi:hypothetical protein
VEDAEYGLALGRHLPPLGAEQTGQFLRGPHAAERITKPCGLTIIVG